MATPAPHLMPLASNGYRMPAEWEPHRATWLVWPHAEETWPNNRLPLVAEAYAAMVKALVESEEVHLLVNGHEIEAWARGILKKARADAANVHFHNIETNDAWVRDSGPIWVVRDGNGTPDPAMPRRLATCWRFNSWGGKYPHELDARVNQRIAQATGDLSVDGEMVLEGGSIDVNGRGVLLTTEACLLNKNRNPHMSREQIEQRLRDFLGVQQIVWLGDGIAGDDTDGHVDDISRFVRPDTIVTAVETNPDDLNFAPLQENLEQLEALRDPSGSSFEVVEIPMPEPLLDEQGERLPASYANFLIANSAVLVPVFDQHRDDQALGILQDLFPGRTIKPIPARNLVYGLGAVHCLSQQEPL